MTDLDSRDSSIGPSHTCVNGRRGVVMLCHGSRRGASRDECSCSWAAQDGRWPDWCRHCPSTPVGLSEASELLQLDLGNDEADVLVSCLEFIEPFPGDAVEILAGRGREDVVIMPYLLGHGKHATDELEEVLEEVRVRTPGVTVRLAEGLGSDSRLADLVVIGSAIWMARRTWCRVMDGPSASWW